MNPTPAWWVTSHARLLPSSGTALDLASGRGRHALWLAAGGLTVTAIDRDSVALKGLRDDADDAGLHVHTLVRDLEASDFLFDTAFDVIVVVHYLHRPLVPRLIAALRPGGLLVYETFTRSQALLGKPSNPAYLLDSGELEHLVAPLSILDSREGFFDQRFVASVVAQK